MEYHSERAHRAAGAGVDESHVNHRRIQYEIEHIARGKVDAKIVPVLGHPSQQLNRIGLGCHVVI